MSKLPCQPAIMAPQTPHAMYLFFDLDEYITVNDFVKPLKKLAEQVDGKSIIMGIGPTLLAALPKPKVSIPKFPTFHVPPASVPYIPISLLLIIRGQDRGEILHQAMKIKLDLEPKYKLVSAVDCYMFKTNRDLSDYEDGTENPKGKAATDAAIIHSDDLDIHGSSLVAVQQWLHSFEKLEKYTQTQRDNMVGRKFDTNEELEDAPESSHVKRTAQEDFSPEAFIWRKSMPWSKACEGGLMFTAYSKDEYAFTTQMRRMSGEEDGIVDDVFKFSYPFTGCFFWCPPVKDGKINLNAILK